MLIYKDEEVEYAKTRLVDTIVLLDKEPIHVTDVIIARKPIVLGVHIYTESPVNVDMNKIDLTPIHLGYVNFKSTLNYLVRMPIRGDYRQGLRYQNMTSLCGHRPGDIPWKVIYHSIKNNYPTLESVMKGIKTKGAQAWHRDWGVETDGSLIYKGEELVGSIKESKGKFIPELDKDYLFLCEYLEAAMVESARKNA